MSENTTLEQLTEFYLNEKNMIEDLFGKSDFETPAPKINREVIDNIKNFSKVLSIRESNIINRYEIILN